MTNSKNTTLSTKISHVKGNKQKSAGKPGKSSQKSSKVTNTHHKTLAKLFPSIRSRKEALHIISSQNQLSLIFQQWSVSEQELFLDYCTGAKGVKVLYDGIFKEIFNPEATPGRLEELLSLLLNRKVKIRQILPNDSVRLGSESSLLYTDIIVQLEDGSLSNVEVQKIGYAFPGERCACYSADHLLRQYKRVREEQSRKGERFNYRKIKDVRTIVFFEQAPKEFHKFPNHWLHRFRPQSDTGLVLNLLQEYYFIPLDIFKKNMENKSIGNDLEAWLSFLCFDEPERIEELITHYPRFTAMYQDIYEICRNMEKVMNMYSKELQELDHNTVLYMIDEMQDELNQTKEQLEQAGRQLSQKYELLSQQDELLSQQSEQLSQQSEQLSQQSEQLSQQSEQLSQQSILIRELQSQLAALQEKK